jgi:acid phosphatase family membrane protein YuiD
MNQAGGEPAYVVSAEEILCGILLVAVTMVAHGLGMVLTLYASRSFAERFATGRSLLVGLGTLILASWIIVLVHCGEVAIWAAFFHFWTGGMPNASTAYHYALLEYTTLGSSLDLPLHWRLLEGLIAIAGVLAFAWSTSVLLTLAQGFQEQQLLALEQRRKRKGHRPGPTPSAPGPSADGRRPEE